MIRILARIRIVKLIITRVLCQDPTNCQAQAWQTDIKISSGGKNFAELAAITQKII